MDYDALLKKLKRRLKIFHDEEDENLKDILTESNQILINAMGFEDGTDSAYVSLLIKRAMYDYNDQGEYFFENYRSEMNDVILNHSGGDEDVDEKPTET